MDADRSRSNRTLALVTVGAIALAAGGAGWALRSAGRGPDRSAVVAAHLALAAVTNATEEPALAALLAIEAAGRSAGLGSDDGYSARNALVTTLTTHPRLISEFDLGDSTAAVAVTFSSDGRRLAASSREGSIVSWDVARHEAIGRPLAVGPACGDTDVDDLRYSNDGVILVHVNCYSATVIVAGTMRRRSRLDLITDAYGEEEVWVEIAPDAEALAVDGEYAGFRFLDPVTGRQIRTGVGARRDVLGAADVFSSDGRAIAARTPGPTSSAPSLIRALDTADGSAIGGPLPARAIALGRGGALAVLAPEGSPLILWDVLRGKRLATLLKGSDTPLRAEFDRSGERLAVSTDDGIVHVLSVGARGVVREITSVEHRGVAGLRFSPDAATLATAGLDGNVRLWDVASRVPFAKRLDSAGSDAVAFQPHGRLLAAATGDELVLWAVDPSGTSRLVERTVTDASNLAFSADGELLATGGGDLSGVVRFWDVSNGRAVLAGRVQADEYFVDDVAFVPDGTKLLTAGSDIRAYRTDDHTLVAPLIRGTERDGFLFAVPSPDGSIVVTAAGLPDVLGGGRLQFRDLESGRLLRKPTPYYVNNALFSEGGSVLITGDDAGRLTFRDVPTLDRRTALVAHPDPSVRGCCSGVTALGLAADGRTLVTSGLDDVVRIWDATTAQPLGLPLSTVPLADEDATPRDVTVSERGFLATADDDGTYLWDPLLLSTRLEDWRTALCNRAGRNLTVSEWRRFLPDEPYRATCPGP